MVKEDALVTLQHRARHVLGARDAAFRQPVKEAPDVKAVVVNGAGRVVARLQPAAVFFQQFLDAHGYDLRCDGPCGSHLQMCVSVRPSGVQQDRVSIGGNGWRGCFVIPRQVAVLPRHPRPKTRQVSP